MSQTDSRHALRQQIRRHRRNLSASQQRSAALGLARQLHQQFWFQRARHLGLYLPLHGEIDPLPALTRHWPASRQLYLPVVSSNPAPGMSMHPWTPGEQLLTNHFGIAEPISPPDAARPLWALDLLLIPLVAFDRQGNRLGMGGGYYDRLLATLSHRPHKPLLVGIAHSFQEQAKLDAAPWDQSLMMVVTEKEVIDCRRQRRRQ